MTLLGPKESREMMKNLIRRVKYSGVELKESEPILYNLEQTPIQRQIEMSVTHGRGYTHIQDSLNIVNKRAQLPMLDLHDVFEAGLIPIYFKSPSEIPFEDRNPCGEIISTKFFKVMPLVFRQKTLLERLMHEQNIRYQINKYTILGSSPGIEPIFSFGLFK